LPGSLKPNGQLDFSDPAAVQQLTKSLLERDFGLKLDLPDDRLCPPVPNRCVGKVSLGDMGIAAKHSRG
jgi:23S rRNA A1618 N6-methylase RlmF